MSCHEDRRPAEGRVVAGTVLAWPPAGAGDFAELAWIVARTLGNGSGVSALTVRTGRFGPYVEVEASSADWVRTVASGPGWDVYEPNDTQVFASGAVAGMRVSLSWNSLPPRDPWKPAA